ncbi:hypothetical protein GCM10010218_11950 [Streptomyces mashuensis]|uniref:Uncharacterized protein n=1 Tax=Streptomyces mashuensis TaxID=33904 RepID=A0A919B0L6_9ACTN|nr:DUF6153 family protein [Streptomyces mashuensis]GHF32515.1 hypothetical protein GCM10010218_11950 [Streptomyces mashuensis]
MRRERGTGAWCGRLLLLAALLLGIVTMHTLGHPRDHDTDRATVAMGAMAGHADGHAAGHGAPAAHDGPRAVSPAHGGMDPMSVCLAVLGTGWATVLLLLAALAALVLLRTTAGRGSAPRGRAWFSRAQWCRPPPPRHKALARLSVLRV